MKLRVLAGYVLWVSKRVLGLPDFRLYALADKSRQFLFSQTQGLTKLLKMQSPLLVQRAPFDS